MNDEPNDSAQRAPGTKPRGSKAAASRGGRIAVIGASAVAAAAVGYGLSVITGTCTTCATGNSPLAFALLLAAVAGWSALDATRRRH